MRIAVFAVSGFLAFSPWVASAGSAKTVLCSRVEAMPMTHPLKGLRFDHNDHRLWYQRFWTGSCKGLSFFQCFPGKPFWCETLGKALDRVSLTPLERRSLAVRMVALGRLIGHEWARDNDIRKIDTSDIKTWYRDLEKPGNLASALDRIEAAARAKLDHR